MSELSLQKDVVNSINNNGGHAFKSSNRFLVGVPDLWCKTKNGPGAWIEVKKSALPVRVGHVILELTVPQRRFLMAEHNAGGVVGVLSFIVGKGKLWAKIVKITDFPDDQKLLVSDHKLITNRNRNLELLVWDFATEY